MSQVRCLTCKASSKEGYELICYYPYCRGRVAVNARLKLSRDEDKWRYVSGRENAKDCQFYMERGL